MHARKQRPVGYAEWEVLLRWRLHHELAPLLLRTMKLTFYWSVERRFMLEALQHKIEVIVEVKFVEYKDGLR